MTESSDSSLSSQTPSAADPDAELVDPFVFSLPSEAHTLREQGLWAAVLALLVLVTYWPATTGSFIWDDARHVSENKLLSDPGGLAKIWTGRWTDPAAYPLPQYYPFTHTSFWIEYNTVGSDNGRALPFSYHVTNIALHAISAVLLWLILRHLKVPGAWVAAAVFALHPLDVESVAWISERKNVLAGVLFFGSIGLYLLADEPPQKARAKNLRWFFYSGALLAFTLAMLSKTTACAMPAVMVLLLWWKRRLTGRQWAMLSPFFVIGLGLGLSTASFERVHVGATGPDWDFTPADRLIIAGRAVWFYVGKLFAPTRLSFSYHRWALHPGEGLQYLPAAAVVVVLGMLLALQRSIGRAPVVAAAAFCVCLFPALGFFNVYPMRYTFVADHYAYFATAVFAAALVGGFGRLIARLSTGSSVPVVPTALSMLLLLTLGSLAWSRTHALLDPVTLWTDTVAKNPTSWLAHGNLGASLESQALIDRENGDTDTADSELELAVAHERAAVHYRPDDAIAEWGWARALGAQGKNTEAVEHFRRAIAIDNQLADARKDLADTLLRMGRNDEAIATLNQVLAIAPHSSRTHELLAKAYQNKRDYRRSIAEDEAALLIKPDNYTAREQLGRLQAQAGNYHEAAVQLAVVISAQPHRADIWNLLGIIEAEQGRLGPADEFFKTAIKIDPTNDEYQHNLDRTEAEMKRVMAKHAATRSTTKPAK